MSDSHYFERLLETVGLIARHADYPGKGQVVERCREEVEEMSSAGAINSAQAEILRNILLGVRVEALG
ncbi:MAG: hypothetical protein ACP5XB_10690 [Isosphaeraceae bacterium]